jgi:hypothetical protein
MTPKDFAPDSVEMVNFFIDFFKSYTNSSTRDNRDIQFDGEGAYFGKQISIREGSANRYGMHTYETEVTQIEVAYDFVAGNICIYSDNHNGFWVNPYLSITQYHSEYPKLKEALHKMLLDYFGV